MTRMHLWGLAASLSLGSALPGCGSPEPLPSHMPRVPRAVGPVQVYPGSPELQVAKAALAEAARQAGACPERVALVVAVAMAETEHCHASERDAGKDQAGDAANLSCLNMNKAFLKSMGWQEGQPPDLNDQANLAAAVGWAVRGMERLGEDGFLNYHRGGETGFRDGISYGCAEYRTAIRQVQARLLAEPGLLTGPQRVGCDIPHV